MNEDKIKAAIADWISKRVEHIYHPDGERVAFNEVCEYHDFQENEFYEKVASELYAAIAPHLEASPDWAEAPEWAEWRTVDEDGTITFWEMKPEKGRDSWHHGSIRSGITECVQKEEKEWYSSLRRRPE